MIKSSILLSTLFSLSSAMDSVAIIGIAVASSVVGCILVSVVVACLFGYCYYTAMDRRGGGNHGGDFGGGVFIAGICAGIGLGLGLGYGLQPSS
jgi:hypothetical protein